MKRSFVYLVFALTLSLLLCGCGSMRDNGNVTASPWPDVTEPVLPTPTSAVSPALTPENGAGIAGSGADNPVGTAAPDMGGSSPSPMDPNR